MRGGRIAMLVVGVVVGLVSFGLIVGGAALLFVHGTQRDDDGFYRSSNEALSTATYALVSERVDLGAETDGDWGPVDDIGTVELAARRVDGGQVFVGIGPADAVAAWLAGVASEELPSHDVRPGEAPAGVPGEAPFWAASAAGSGRQILRWEVASGDWAAVVMNADASLGVSVDATVGVKTDLLLPVGLGLLAVGLAAAAVGVLLIVLGAREEQDEVAPERAAAGPYPARLDGHLDLPLSRGLWLVKWFLALPHLAVLAFLWIGLCFTTFAAGMSILFTGRYPRTLFDYAVGVLRWTWRVAFYAFTLGTDRYPPFSLAADPSYPAGFDVDYPASLSRGLVLVKWWLLALPHYLVLAAFGGDGIGLVGAGLIGVLVLVAAVSLLFTGRYPDAVFDFVMGMQRWTYRVFAYAGLLRDEYPPFRLEMGGADPGSVVVPQTEMEVQR